MFEFLRDERAATSIEYGIIAALVAVAIIAALIFLGDSLNNIFNTVGNSLQTDGGGGGRQGKGRGGN